MRSRTDSFALAVGAATVIALVFLLAPLAMVIVNSLGPEGLAFFPPPHLSVAAYATIPARWLTATLNSVLLAVLAAALAAVLGTCAALGLARGRWSNGAATLIDGILRLPLQAPALVLGVAFLQYYAWLNATAGLDVRGSFLGLLLAHTAVSISFVLTVVLARVVSFDRRLEEAAMGLGATPLQTFTKVTLPIIGPAVLSGCFFGFLAVARQRAALAVPRGSGSAAVAGRPVHVDSVRRSHPHNLCGRDAGVLVHHPHCRACVPRSTSVLTMARP